MSAADMTVIAGLVPEHVSEHPLWLLLCQGIAHLPLCTLSLRLNAVSAVCGAAATLLLGTLVAPVLYAMACEDGGGSDGRRRPRDGGSTDDGISAAVRVYNHRAFYAAAIGGAVAAAAFAFSAAGWSASTRLHYENFDALLLLAAGHLLLAYKRRHRRSQVLLLACLCGAGCVESLAFIVLAPVFFVVVAWNVLLTTKKHMRGRLQLLLTLLLSTGAGAFANLLLLRHLAASGAPDGPSLFAVFANTARYHYSMLKNALPHIGWLWVVLLAFVPTALAAFGGRRAFRNRSAGMPVVHGLLTLANVLCLANAAFSPWGQARASGGLPVMAYLAVAASSGYLFAYWRMLAAPPDTSIGKRLRHRLNTTGDFWMGSIMMWVPIATVCLAPLANLSEANGRLGEFADRVARDVLTRLGDRTWVASDGLLDNHLLLAAQAQGRTLRVIDLSKDRSPIRLHQIRAWIDADPRFAACRLRMENAVALGAAAFVDAWLRVDPAADRGLFAVGAPELWQRSGWRPVPEGYGFGGVRSLDALHRVDLLTTNRAAWDRLAEILAPATHLPPPSERVRQVVCRQSSRAANDLGVLLDDLGRTNDATEAYLAAIRFDNRNVCARLNLLGLPAIRDAARKNLEQEVRALVDAVNPRLSILAVVLTYGEIRQPDILAKCGRAWSLLGQPTLAQSQLDRAAALAPSSLNARQLLLANTLAVHGDLPAAMRAYRAAVASSPDNTTAMIGLATMCLCGGQTTEARQWLDQSRQAGAQEPAWAVLHASLLLAEGQTNDALAYLRLFTENNPGQMEAWALEADILLKQQALGAVEQQILPAMCKAAAPSDHVLIHIVRAHLLAHKKPVDDRALRNALLHALRLWPDLADVRDDLLRADLQGGNRNDLLADVNETLRFNADHALANYISGNMLIAQGELKRAEEHFRRSLASGPSTAAFNDLAETLRRLGRFAEAEQMAREAIAREPGCGQAWDTLGRILLDTSRVAEAGQAIGQALALRPQDPCLELSLARVRLAQGDPGACRQILQHPAFAADKLPADLRAEAEALMRSAGTGKSAASAFAPSAR